MTCRVCLLDEGDCECSYKKKSLGTMSLFEECYDDE